MRKIIIPWREKMGIIAVVLILMLIAVVLYFYKGGVSYLPVDIKAKYRYEEKVFQERKVFTVSPEETKTKKTILYIHGGAYLGELNREHWDLFTNIIEETGCQVIAPDYPLTPKYTYEDVFGMIKPLYEEISQKIGTENLILIGDSAGGGICLGLIEKLTEEEKQLPAKTILISPWIDVRMTNPEIDEIQKKDPYLNKVALRLAGEAYSGGTGMESYLVNPIEGPIQKLENVVIFTGTDDILNPDVKKLEERVNREKADIHFKETEGAKHDWILKRREKEYMAEEGYQEFIKEIKETCNG